VILFAFADVRTTLAWSFQSSFNLLKRRLQISSKMKLWTVLVVLQCLTVCFSIVCCRPRMRGMRNNSNSNNNNNNRRTRLRNNRRVTGTHRARRRLILSRDSQPESVENMDKIIRQLTAEQIQLRPDSSEESRSQHWNLDELDNLMPDVECPTAEDGYKLFACPSPSIGRQGRAHYQCIDDHALCDGVVNCPNGEDEDKTICMFHKVTMNYLKTMMTALTAVSQAVV